MAKGWSIALVRQGGGHGRRTLADAVAALRPSDLRGAPRRGPPAGHRHHDAGRPGGAAGRGAGLRRRHRHHATARATVATTARIDGLFVWGKDKARAVAEWADAHDVDLDASLRLLRQLLRRAAAVHRGPSHRGEPRSPDAGRWPWPDAGRCVHLDVPHGVPKFAGRGAPAGAVQLLAQTAAVPLRPVRPGRPGAASRCTARPSSWPTTAATSTRWPSATCWPGGAGPCGSWARRRSSTPRSWATSAAAMGGIRVDRGTGSDEPLQAAEDALAAGEMVAIMPQGTIPRGPAFFDPELKGRWGAVKLAHASGAPIIPVGIWGTERVWPRSVEAAPNVTNVLAPPTVQHPGGRTRGRCQRRPRGRGHRTMMAADRGPAPRGGPPSSASPPARSWRATYPDGRVPETWRTRRPTRATVAPAPTETRRPGRAPPQAECAPPRSGCRSARGCGSAGRVSAGR